MRKIAFFFLLTAAAGLVQAAFLDRVQLFGARPDLFLASTVIAAVSLDGRGAVAAAVLNGLVKDMLDPGVFGFNTAVFALMALAVSKLNRSLSLDQEFPCAVVTGAGVITANLCAWILLASFQAAVPRGIFLRSMFLGALFTALCVAPLWALVRAARRSVR